MRVAKECAEAAAREGFFYIFKSSYLKDNRSSIDSYTGPGLEKGLEMLATIKAKAKVPRPHRRALPRGDPEGRRASST